MNDNKEKKEQGVVLKNKKQTDRSWSMCVNLMSKMTNCMYIYIYIYIYWNGGDGG